MNEPQPTHFRRRTDDFVYSGGLPGWSPDPGGRRRDPLRRSIKWPPPVAPASFCTACNDLELGAIVDPGSAQGSFPNQRSPGLYRIINGDKPDGDRTGEVMAEIASFPTFLPLSPS
jgi:hypothetical protein